MIPYFDKFHHEGCEYAHQRYIPTYLTDIYHSHLTDQWCDFWRYHCWQYCWHKARAEDLAWTFYKLPISSRTRIADQSNPTQSVALRNQECVKAADSTLNNCLIPTAFSTTVKDTALKYHRQAHNLQLNSVPGHCKPGLLILMQLFICGKVKWQLSATGCIHIYSKNQASMVRISSSVAQADCIPAGIFGQTVQSPFTWF